MRLQLCLFALLGCGAAAINEQAGGDRTITKVIKMLQGMVEKSKADGEKDVKIFAKFQCFCDSNQAEKTKAIEDSANMITQLGAEIGELEGSKWPCRTTRQHGLLQTHSAQRQTTHLWLKSP